MNVRIRPTALLPVIALLLLVPGVANAAKKRQPALTGRLTYTCGYDICQRAASGGTATKLTKGGTKKQPFVFGATSRNGKLTVYSRSGEKKVWVYVKRGGKPAKAQVSTYWGVPFGFPRVNADATRIMWNEIAFVYNPYLVLALTPHAVSIAPTDTKIDGTDGVNMAWVSHVGFGRKQTYLSLDSTGTKLCERPIKEKDGTDCGATVADSGGTSRTIGPVSELTPDSRLLVTTTADNLAGGRSWVSVFDARTGTLVRHLTTKGHEYDPTVSPNGKQVAYECGANVCVRPITGGAERVLLRKASYPTWSK